MAYGLSTGSDASSGLQQALELIAGETLIGFGRDGRPLARLAESWTPSSDGLSLTIQLRNNAKFHDGRAVTAADVSNTLRDRLQATLGAGFADVAEVRAASSLQVEIVLRRRSAFVFEALADAGVKGSEVGEGQSNGTGPFKLTNVSEAGAELIANHDYYAGKPLIDRIEVKPYSSVRAAWADMLRGQADMLYEVGPDAIQILQPSKAVRVISHLRNYQFVGMLNVRHPTLKDAAFRRALNTAIDRQSLVSEILRSHGLPADGAVWPSNWAYDGTAPVFSYEPREISGARTKLACVLGEVAHERFALGLQQQLQRIGVDLQCELLPVDKVLARVRKGDFDLFLIDLQNGPTLLQAYRTWRTGAPRNMGGYSSPEVDAALDQINVSGNDDEYRAGVAAFQRAIYDDPPAIFIAWSERARAVSTRFDVPIEPGRDILGTLRQWKPVPDQVLSTQN
jgi:peptide/nickel transport system substrate-binding protein